MGNKSRPWSNILSAWHYPKTMAMFVNPVHFPELVLAIFLLLNKAMKVLRMQTLLTVTNPHSYPSCCAVWHTMTLNVPIIVFPCWCWIRLPIMLHGMRLPYIIFWLWWTCGAVSRSDCTAVSSYCRVGRKRKMVWEKAKRQNSKTQQSEQANESEWSLNPWDHQAISWENLEALRLKRNEWFEATLKKKSINPSLFS